MISAAVVERDALVRVGRNHASAEISRIPANRACEPRKNLQLVCVRPSPSLAYRSSWRSRSATGTRPRAEDHSQQRQNRKHFTHCSGVGPDLQPPRGPGRGTWMFCGPFSLVLLGAAGQAKASTPFSSIATEKFRPTMSTNMASSERWTSKDARTNPRKRSF